MCLTYKGNKECYNDNLCLLRANCMHKTGRERVEAQTSNFFNQYVDITPNVTVEHFRGVALEDLRIVERLAVNILVQDIEVSDNEIFGKLAEQYLRRFSSTANLLR